MRISGHLCHRALFLWWVRQIASQLLSCEIPALNKPLFVKVSCPFWLTMLPTAGIDLILANDVAGGKVFPSLVVTDDPTSTVCISPAALDSPPLFPVCAVTRAQARKYAECVDLSDSFLSNSAQTSTAPENSTVTCSVSIELGPDDESLKMSVDREHLIREQQTDPTLTSCFSQVNQHTPDKSVFHLLDDGVLMRCWSPSFTHESMCQIALPQLFRSQVLTLAHDHCLSGHLGINKTYQRILRFFLARTKVRRGKVLSFLPHLPSFWQAESKNSCFSIASHPCSR